jgi:NitT/TauT family transport system permease protein
VRLRDRHADTGWGAVGLLVLACGWVWANRAYGPFALPALDDTACALVDLFSSGAAAKALGVTLLHAVGGSISGSLTGFLLGVAGGLSRPAGAGLRPVVTALLGVPPVAWVVLTFLWFGPGLISPLFTVWVATFPIIFAAAMQGVRGRSEQLVEMARVFRLPRRTRFFRIMLPEIAVQIAPALSTTFALSWKVALTAEVLGDGTGIGGAFATARAHLELPEAMAWIVLVVVFLLITDGLLLGPLRRWIARHREADRVGEAGEGQTCVGIGLMGKTRDAEI